MGKMRSFRRGLRNCVGRPLAYGIKEGFGATAAAVLQRLMRGEKVHDGEIHEMFVGESEVTEAKQIAVVAGPTIIQGAVKGKNIAIVPVKGVALYDTEYQPYCFSTLGLSMLMNQLAADPDIGTVILDIDSPGGQVTGTKEAADAVYALGQKKRVVALVEPLAASAAYWIASQASEIIAVPSADVGSIGVFMAHTDCSVFNEQQGIKVTYIYAGEHKVEGNMDEPLGDDALAYFQSEVDVIYDQFLNAVARGRKTTYADVRKNFGGGRCLMADQALKLGMIDSIATVDQALAKSGIMLMSSSKKSEGVDMQPEASYVALPDETETTVDDDFFSTLGECNGDGMEPIVVFQVADEESTKSYVEKWPLRASFLKEIAVDFPRIKNTIRIEMANGTASYSLLGKTDHDVIVGALMHGTITGPVPFKSTEELAPVYDPSIPLEPSDEAKAKAAAYAETSRLAAAARRARMLALARFR